MGQVPGLESGDAYGLVRVIILNVAQGNDSGEIKGIDGVLYAAVTMSDDVDYMPGKSLLEDHRNVLLGIARKRVDALVLVEELEVGDVAVHRVEVVLGQQAKGRAGVEGNHSLLLLRLSCPILRPMHHEIRIKSK